MYEAFFGMQRRPFTAVPQGECFFGAGSPERSRLALSRAIERAEGLGLLVGPAGTGKTLLLQVLADQFRGSFHVALLTGARLCTRRALLQNILFELKLNYRHLEEGELRLSLLDFLSTNAAASLGLLLLVDEAHALPLRLLEEIRMMTNLVRDGQPRVRLVLAGSAALEDRFASPKLESLNQRVAVRSYLEPFTREEVGQYVRWHLQRAGAAQSSFSDSALQAIHSASDGVPRLVNQLCDHALILACTAGQRIIEAGQIDDAWADLQQLPMPLSEKPAAIEGGTIEFGSLSDELSESAPFAAAAEAHEATSLRFAGEKIDRRLEAIERQVAAAGADWPAEDHLAAGETGPNADFHPGSRFSNEVELVFHGPHNPFGETFLEEEVLLDPYANTDSLPERPLVRCAEGSELAALLSQFETRLAPPPTVRIAATGEPALSREIGNGVRPAAAAEHEPLDVVRPPLETAAELASDDDRDILVIEEDHAGVPPASRARRKEYRQLFAQLRRG